MLFSGILLPPRTASSAVITTLAPASLMRAATASEEKPAKMTEWTAPILAVASMAATASGVTGM